MMMDDEDKFRSIAGSAFGQMESALGPEMYQLNIKIGEEHLANAKAQGDAQRKHTDVMVQHMENTRVMIVLAFFALVPFWIYAVVYGFQLVF